MPKSSSQSWLGLSIDAWWLGVESATVIGLRSMKLASGGADANAEASRMINEKFATAIEIQTAIMTGQLGNDPLTAGRAVVKRYNCKVSANRRRLSSK